MKSPHVVTEFAPTPLRKELEALGQPGYRGGQILRHVYQRRVSDYAAMTDLPADLRADLPGRLPLLSSTVARRSASPDGTTKLLLRLHDGETVECVMIPEGKRRTVCLSTQVGCPVACIFCASGAAGVKRNLAACEIVEQALHLQHALPADERVNSVVVMGMGEPFLNYDRLVRALETLHAPWGMGIGTHHITVSTVGLVDKIEAFADHPLATHLAVSLHAPDDELRAELIPNVAKASISDLVRAAVSYKRRTGKEVTFEYVLLAGRNDQVRHAHALARRVSGTGIKVNLIPLNKIDFAPLTAPAPTQVRTFQSALEQAGVTCTVRRRRGSEIDAACGQLRLTEMKK